MVGTKMDGMYTDPVVKKACRWLHDWAFWEIVERYDLSVDGRKVGWAITQERRCLRCGHTQLGKQTKYA